MIPVMLKNDTCVILVGACACVCVTEQTKNIQANKYVDINKSYLFTYQFKLTIVNVSEFVFRRWTKSPAGDPYKRD